MERHVVARQLDLSRFLRGSESLLIYWSILDHQGPGGFSPDAPVLSAQEDQCEVLSAMCFIEGSEVEGGVKVHVFGLKFFISCRRSDSIVA